MTTWRPAPRTAEEREPLPVATSLDRVSRALGAAPARVLGAVFSHWEQLVGPEIAAHARPTSLRGGVLVVVVDQPAWAAQLRFMATDLLTRCPGRGRGPGHRPTRGPHGWSTGGSGAVGARALDGRSSGRAGPVPSPPSGTMVSSEFMALTSDFIPW